MKHLELLERALKQEKLAHAYLLSGNDRKGKEELVESFLPMLFPETNLRVHPDVFFVDPVNDIIAIDQVRQLKDRLSYSAWRGGYKAAVVNSAELMGQDAQAALLKLLEEPKGNTVLFLITEYPALLLGTMRSRAQELKMNVFPQRARTPGLLAKLQQASIAERFAFAAKAAEDPKEMYQTLLGILRELRSQLFLEAKLGTKDSLSTLRSFQKVLYQLRSTNVNCKLAAERILLEL